MVKLEISADDAKARAAFERVAKSEQAAIANVQALIKETEKLERARLKELETARKAKELAKEAASENKKLASENQKQAKEVDRLNEALARQKATQKSMYAEGMNGARGFILQYVGIQQAIDHVNAAMERTRQLSEASLTANERVARAQRSVMLNMPGASKADISGVDARIRAAAGRSRAPDLAAFYESVASSSAATGGNIDAAIAGTAATVPFTRLAPEDLPVISSAALEIGKAAGSSDYERSIGMLLQIGGVTRQPNTADFARAITPALAAGAGNSANAGAGMESAAELFATLSNATGDVRGLSSATSVSTLVVKMKEFFDKKGIDPGTPSARIEALQSNAAMREEFLNGYTGEIAFQTPIRQLLTRGTSIAAQHESNRGAIDFATADQMYSATIGNVTGGTSEIQQAEASAISAGLSEGVMAATGMSDRAFAKQQLDRAINIAHPGVAEYLWGGYSRQLVYNVAQEMGSDTPYGAAGTEIGLLLEGEKSQMRSNPSASQQAVVDALEAILRELRDQESRRANTVAPVQTEGWK